MAALTLVDILDTTNGIRWLMNQDIPFNWEAWVEHTPHLRGVYRMLNNQHKVIYVGKAINLPKRFVSYFTGKSHREEMRPYIALMQTVYLFTNNQTMELEYNIYIKYHLPYFNKTTPENSRYLMLTTNTEYQSLYPMGVWRRDLLQLGDTAEFVGPFTNTRVYNDIIREFQQVFKLPNCTPTKFRKHHKGGFGCDEFDFKRCKGYCINATPHEYEKYWIPIKQIIMGKGELGKSLFKQVADRMPATKKHLFNRSILDTLDFRDNFDILYLHRQQGMACMSVIEVSTGQVIDIRNLVAADAHDSRNLTPLQEKLDKLSNQELFTGFLAAYFQVARSPEYICDNQIINHFPTKLVIVNSEFTPDLATHYSLELSKIFGYKVKLATRAPAKLIELAAYNAFFALYQRLGLLGRDAQTLLDHIPNRDWLKCLDLKTTESED